MALPVITWTLSLRNRLAEITSSATAGLAQWQSTVSEADGTCEVLWDSTAIPDTDNGLTRGASVTVRLDIGDSGKFYTGTALIENLSLKVNNLSDVVKADITFRYSGSLTLPVT